MDANDDSDSDGSCDSADLCTGDDATGAAADEDAPKGKAKDTKAKAAATAGEATTDPAEAAAATTSDPPPSGGRRGSRGPRGRSRRRGLHR